MKNKRNHSGFTLVEMIVTFGILSLVTGGILMGIIQIARSVEKTTNFTFARKELSVFVQGVYSFTNKSYGAYFWNTASSAAIDFLNSYPTVFPKGNAVWDTVYLVKDTVGTTGQMAYSPSAHTITWTKDATSSPEIMLAKVYRSDYVSDASPGVEPIFRFPHRDYLFTDVGHTRPLYIIVEFKKRIAEPTSTNPNPIEIPVKLMYQLNAVN